MDLQSVFNTAKPAADVAKGAIDTAMPLAFKFFHFLTHTDFATLAQYGLGAGAITFLVNSPCLLPPPSLKYDFSSLLLECYT